NGVIEPSSAIKGELGIFPLAGRNFNFVVQDAVRAVLLKQGVWLEDVRAAVLNERDFYQHVLPQLDVGLRSQIPRLIFADPVQEALVLEFLPNSMSLFQLCQALPRQ